MRDDAAHGRISLLSITPQLTSGAKVSWASIAAGSQDSVIRTQADQLRTLGSPVILIFHHEADISSGYGTAPQFACMYS